MFCGNYVWTLEELTDFYSQVGDIIFTFYQKYMRLLLYLHF